MPPRHKLLLLDDDPDVLELYREILSRLPTPVEIHTATSGARAISLLESEPFTLLISDLNMPKMDGLQVLTIVRRRFPELRTAVMTSIADEQFRSRAYAIGIDLLLEKPQSGKEVQFFLDCVESLLDREQSSGFRGIQSKSLVDIIQLECLSKSSGTLKITHGLIEGRIWIEDGEVIDARIGELKGNSAFQQILSWRTGNFEMLPPERERARTIYTSYQGLLLETAQALDEAGSGSEKLEESENGGVSSPLAEVFHSNQVEFVLAASSTNEATEAWGVENPEQLQKWMRNTWEMFRTCGDNLQAGTLSRIEGYGIQRHVALASSGEKDVCVGFHRSADKETVRETMRRVLSQWAS